MNQQNEDSMNFIDLVEGYISGEIGGARLRKLENLLLKDAEARGTFVRYLRMHTDIYQVVRSDKSRRRALDSIDQIALECEDDTSGAAEGDSQSKQATFPAGLVQMQEWLPSSPPVRFALAAFVILCMALLWSPLASRRGPAVASQGSIAWLVNGQDCQWAAGQVPHGDFCPGRILELKSGLAELRFASQTTALLEGPCELELLGGKSARLLRGKLTANVPPQVDGFEILSRHGRIIDMGTEFGVEVDEDETTRVFVFDGKVDAFAGKGEDNGKNRLRVLKDQMARIDATGVRIERNPERADVFARKIQLPPVDEAHCLVLDFGQPLEGTLADATGLGTGLTHRLPGTGVALPTNDTNLRLNTDEGQLELTTTNSDINTQFNLEQGEYLGVRLSHLGFTGSEDFEISMVVDNVPKLEKIGQIGLYAGSSSECVVRGGMIFKSGTNAYQQYIVKNNGGLDSDANIFGELEAGTTVRIALKRKGGKCSIVIERGSQDAAMTVTAYSSEFLADKNDLFVGLLGANTQGDTPETLLIKEVVVTVWKQQL